MELGACTLPMEGSSFCYRSFGMSCSISVLVQALVRVHACHVQASWQSEDLPAEASQPPGSASGPEAHQPHRLQASGWAAGAEPPAGATATSTERAPSCVDLRCLEQVLPQC